MATLYLTEPRSLLKKEGDTLVVHVRADKERGTEARKVRVPMIKIDQVVVQGDSTLTSPALGALLEQGVDVCFLAYHGQFRGRLAPAEGKNSLLRLEQFRAHEDRERAFELAKRFVEGKLHNLRTMLLRANRKRKDAEIERAAATIKGTLVGVQELQGVNEPPPDPAHPQMQTPIGRLMGLEGAASAAYFGVFGKLLNGDWSFEGRKRRPPTDPVNALLSYGYVLLMYKVASACQIVGFDPYVGYLHSSQYGKPALALDVMEEFRSVVVDSVVLRLINNGMLKDSDFKEVLGAYRLEDAGRRTFLEKFEERLNTEITHPVFDYKASYRKCIELQVRLLAKALTGDIPAYKPLKVR